MELIKYTPFGNRVRLRNNFDSLFNDFFNPAVFCDNDASVGAWNPSVDIIENEENLVIKADVPGVDKSDINIDVDKLVLTLQGERKIEKDVEKDNYNRRERFYGKFKRAFRLPEGTDTNKIKAEFKDGILNVIIHKPEEKKPKNITVH